MFEGREGPLVLLINRENKNSFAKLASPLEFTHYCWWNEFSAISY